MAMNDTEIISGLKKVIDAAGVDAFTNHARANALISDYFPGNDNAKTRRLIKSIIDVDAFTKVSKAGNSDLDAVCKALKGILVDDESLSEDRAEMALEWVCGALGKRKPNFPKPTPTKPQSTSSSTGSSSTSNQSSTPQRTVNTSTPNTYGINLNHHIKRKKQVNKKLIGGIVAVALFAALFAFVIWPKMIYPNMANDDFNTPEIVQTYSGSYSTGRTEGEAIITISSCDASGNVKGFFEFIADDVYGKYEISGKITSKKNNGNLVIAVTPGQWIVHPNGFTPLEAMKIEIVDNYQSLKCSQYSMNWTVGANDEYLIKTSEDLRKLVGSGATYQLKNDIDLGGAEWTPIEGFTGTLIGNGFTIENFKINSMQNNVGLFSTIEGFVSDLTIKNATVTATGRTERIGILCGELKGMVSGIHIESSEINAPNSNYVGAVAGYVSKLSQNVTITGITTDAKVVGREYVGGVFGSVTPACHGEGDSATFSNINNKGAITGENYVGGLFGNMYFNGSHAIVHYDFPAYLVSVSNEGDITGKTYVGGIVGSGDTDTNDSYIQNSSNKANIVGDAMVGCIAGFCDLTVDNCTNEGSTLTATGFMMVDGEKHACVGGYVGKGAVINNCTNTVDVVYTGGGKYVAGIMGYSLYYPKNAMLNNLCNKATVSGSDYVGGIFGRVSPESNGDGDSLAFNNMKNEGSVNGKDYVGGILGYLYLNGSHAIVHYDFPAYLTSMENAGSVKGNSYVGGIIGYGRTDTDISEIISSSSAGTVNGNSNTGNIVGKAEKITIR